MQRSGLTVNEMSDLSVSNANGLSVQRSKLLIPRLDSRDHLTKTYRVQLTPEPSHPNQFELPDDNLYRWRDRISLDSYYQ